MLTVLLLTANAQAEPVEFELLDMKGAKHKLSDYRGKWVVVNYWATWCPPCLTEIPELVDFHEDHKDRDAVVLGINFEDISLNGLKQFSEEYFMNYPVLRTSPGPASELGPIPGLPTTYMVSPSGEVVARQVGPVTAKLINDFIAQQSEQSAAQQADQQPEQQPEQQQEQQVP
ncbi:MAG: TlpA disulfide reductase family protein [Gammaproteobacteria bacterium]|nr:TlpA disulfide reductase family protein [Gammaproteobacteria bacterium]